MAEDKPKEKLYRFVPDVKTFYNKQLYKIMNSNGLPSYLDLSVPMAPNHHFSPVGEVVFFKGHTNVKRHLFLLSQMCE